MTVRFFVTEPNRTQADKTLTFDSSKSMSMGLCALLVDECDDVDITDDRGVKVKFRRSDLVLAIVM